MKSISSSNCRVGRRFIDNTQGIEAKYSEEEGRQKRAILLHQSCNKIGLMKAMMGWD
jgi:hypothetical protein